MSKPLELTIYPPLSPTVQRGVDYCIEKGRYPYLGFSTEAAVPGIVRMHAKRLADAELAAEWHRHTHTFDMLAEGYRVESFGTDCIQGGHHEARVLHQQETLHRFATAPHYFEEQG